MPVKREPRKKQNTTQRANGNRDETRVFKPGEDDDELKQWRLGIRIPVPIHRLHRQTVMAGSEIRKRGRRRGIVGRPLAIVQPVRIEQPLDGGVLPLVQTAELD